MDEYLTEQEQWERVKAWFRENGPWIVSGILLAVAGVGGWRWWQSHTNQLALDANARYEQVLQAFDQGDRARALELIDSLEHDHPGSPYVDQANLEAARFFVESNELEQAAERLETVVRESHDPELATIARLRLARVQISLGKPDAALATLGTPQTGAFDSRYHEIRGDAYYAKGDKAAALAEYRAALLAAGPSLAQNAENNVLNLKINDLAGAASPPPSTAVTPHPSSAAAPAASSAGAPRASAASASPSAASRSQPTASR
ncbi:MAG TPA: tetratricopeptide repeat protein [Steroidobacteraceae bacterium]|nr:tetratricopeptide repeat protein [Steroidobacteraceae bacterium]